MADFWHLPKGYAIGCLPAILSMACMGHLLSNQAELNSGIGILEVKEIPRHTPCTSDRQFFWSHAHGPAPYMVYGQLPCYLCSSEGISSTCRASACISWFNRPPSQVHYISEGLLCSALSWPGSPVTSKAFDTDLCARCTIVLALIKVWHDLWWNLLQKKRSWFSCINWLQWD